MDLENVLAAAGAEAESLYLVMDELAPMEFSARASKVLADMRRLLNSSGV